MPDQPDRDSFDLVQEIDVLQKRLGTLDGEWQEAIQQYRDARVNLVVADAAVKACKAELDIKKNRLMSLMSMLRALPK